MLPSAAQEINALRKAATAYRNLSVGTTGQVVRNSAGQIVWYHVTNTDASDLAYLKIYDKATAPSQTDTPIFTLGLPPQGLVAFALIRPMAFSTGIGIRATLNAADADTNAPSSAVIVNLAHGATE